MDPLSWLRQPTRYRILCAAEACFAAQGFDATTVDDILAAAGVSRSHLYYHFPSKDALLSGLVRVRTADLRDAGPAGILTYRDFIRVLVVERILRPQLLDEAWRTACGQIVDGDPEGTLVRAALG